MKNVRFPSWWSTAGSYLYGLFLILFTLYYSYYFLQDSVALMRIWLRLKAMVGFP